MLTMILLCNADGAGRGIVPAIYQRGHHFTMHGPYLEGSQSRLETMYMASPMYPRLHRLYVDSGRKDIQ